MDKKGGCVEKDDPLWYTQTQKGGVCMGKQAITAGAAQVRAYRLAAHHLARPLPAGAFAQAAGVCGVQNSPPGAFETALWNRVQPCAPAGMQAALYEKKTLLQAWSYRGAPVVFPTQESDIFLAPLRAEPGEEPWIYTRGICKSCGCDFQPPAAESSKS